MPQPVIDILSRAYHEYAVKILCGYLKEPKGAPLNAGAYYTAINIHNPGPKEAKFRVKVALAHPGQPGTVTGFHDFTLRADEALELDCELLHKFAEVPGDRFMKGFAVIQCTTRLDVVGVYTAGALQPPCEVATLHLERVAGTLIKP